ncbi:MAG: hypothetical protein ACI8Z7_000054 [Candidatus Nanohaloarchaea archaeon]|jgi:hypothetical protein
MKFQLFGRLRDNQEEENSSQEPETGFSSQDDMSDFGGGLQRTVENLFEQGYSEGEVRQELQGQYSREEVQGAINQAVKTSATTQEDGPEPMTPYKGENKEVSPMDEGFNENEQETEQEMNPQDMNSQPNPGMNQEPIGQQRSEPPAGQNTGNVEELIETIVAENFERVEKEFENAYSEIDEMKEQINSLEERVNELEIRDDEDETQVIQKMDDIEEDINEYQSRIGGLEKAFQQVLPSLVDNVRDLTQLVQEIKQERGIETSSNVDQDDIDDIDMEEW